MLQEGLPIYPIKGRQELRSFFENGIPVFSSLQKDLVDVLLDASNVGASEKLHWSVHHFYTESYHFLQCVVWVFIYLGCYLACAYRGSWALE